MVIAHCLLSLLGGALTVACLWPVLGPWSLILAPFGGSALVIATAVLALLADFLPPSRRVAA